MDVSEFEGRTPVNAGLGTVVTTVLLLVWPLTVAAPALGGLLSGYFQHEGGAGGMKAGATMGGMMLVPAVALAVVAQGILSGYAFVGPMLSQYLPVAVVLIVGYSLVLGVVGGLLGGQIAGGPSATDGGSGRSASAATDAGASGRKTADSSSRRSAAGGSSSGRSALEKMKGESADDGGRSGQSRDAGHADPPASGDSGTTAPACPECGHESPDPNAQFCASCGAELGADCPDCGADLRPDAAYCPNCGAAVEEGNDGGTDRRSPGGTASSRGGRAGDSAGQQAAGAAGRNRSGDGRSGGTSAHRDAGGTGRNAGGSGGSTGTAADSNEHDIQKVEHDDGSVTAHCGGCRAEVRETARTCPDCGATLRNVVFVDADEFR